MINSGVFNYVNVLNKAADASAMRHEAITNNIANVNTPNYKRQDVSFETELSHAMAGSQHRTLKERVADLDLDRINPRVYTDAAGFEYRIDGNNVDIDTENVQMAANQIKYNALTQSIDAEFTGLKAAMK